MGPASRRAFAAAALDVLLVQLQPFAAAFRDLAAEPAGGAAVLHGTHSPEGVPHALRQEAGGHARLRLGQLPLMLQAGQQQGWGTGVVCAEHAWCQMSLA